MAVRTLYLDPGYWAQPGRPEAIHCAEGASYQQACLNCIVPHGCNEGHPDCGIARLRGETRGHKRLGGRSERSQRRARHIKRLLKKAALTWRELYARVPEYDSPYACKAQVLYMARTGELLRVDGCKYTLAPT
jgi:hypothetical protein